MPSLPGSMFAIFAFHYVEGNVRNKGSVIITRTRKRDHNADSTEFFFEKCFFLSFTSSTRCVPPMWGEKKREPADSAKNKNENGNERDFSPSEFSVAFLAFHN